MSELNDGGPAFPADPHAVAGMTMRDYFAANMQADDRLAKAIRAMDDTALAIFALHPELERDESMTETGMLELVPCYAAMTEVEKVITRLELEAKAIARVRYMQADAMLKARGES